MSPLRTWLAAGILILLLCIGGCTQTREIPVRPTPTQVTLFPTVPPQAGPPSATWYLISYYDGNSSVDILPQTEITAFFDGHGTLSGSAGCNLYTVPYSISKENLLTGSPGSMTMNCTSPSGIMAQEALYLAKVRETRQYSAKGNTLTLSDAQGKPLLLYTLIPTGVAVPAPLTGTIWYAGNFGTITGQAMSPGGLTTIRLFFGEDGNVYGNAGCNDYSGSYQVNGENTLTITDLKKTRMYCGIGGVMELEYTYLALLPNVTRYSVSGDTLVLYDTNGTIKMEFDTNYP